MNPIANAIVAVAIAVAVAVPLAMWNGFVIHMMWGWFIVPLGVQSIGIAHAIGFGLFVSLLHRPRIDDDDKKSLWARIGEELARTTLILLIALIVKSWI